MGDPAYGIEDLERDVARVFGVDSPQAELLTQLVRAAARLQGPVAQLAIDHQAVVDMARRTVGFLRTISKATSDAADGAESVLRGGDRGDRDRGERRG